MSSIGVEPAGKASIVEGGRGEAGRLDLGALTTPEAAAALLDGAWPLVIRECRQVLGGELHYQAVVYHCLRQAGAPARQLGMNVKQWISDCTSPLFKARDVRKHPNFQGGYEPIPDLVLFSPEIVGDWRRRNNAATLRHMLMAIEVKASERARGRLRGREVIADLEKLAAHRAEVEHLGGRMEAAMMVIDTAPLPEERMTAQTREAASGAAKELGIRFYYVSGDDMLSA